MEDKEKNKYPTEWMLGKVMGTYYDKCKNVKI